MADQTGHDNYPVLTSLLSVLLLLAIYIIGAYLLSGFGLIAVLLYLLFCLWAEYRVLAMSCRYCYYYGKLCGTGKGKIVPLFFKKGNPKIFPERAIGWKDLIPDLLVFLVPLLGGIIYLFIRFNFLTLALIIAIAVLAMPVTGYMRSCLLCPNCKQRELGCPAQKLFGKEEKSC
ncbi:MAG: hypothetical protein PHG97_05475 [Candidatus Margulisbacteria bacterium]|nr:hypothetical protein [Candidatus Margulisiibacteriota bacterium]